MPKFNWTQTNSDQLSFNDIALETQQPSRRAAGVAMISMKLIGLAEGSAAHGTSVALRGTDLLHQFEGEASSKQASVVITVASKSRSRVVAFFHSILRASLGSLGLRVGFSASNHFWSSVNKFALGCNVGEGKILPLPKSALLFLFRGRIGGADAEKNLFPVSLVPLPRVSLVRRPFFRRAVGLFHVDDLTQILRSILPSSNTWSHP